MCLVSSVDVGLDLVDGAAGAWEGFRFILLGFGLMQCDIIAI